MNWFQILTLVIQELPAIETAALDTVQFITAIVHTASSSGSPAVATAAMAIKAKSAPKAPVAPAPVAPPPAPAAPTQGIGPVPTLTPFKA